MNKQQYLATVAQWKLDHVALIKAIRAAKIAYKDAQRAGVSVYSAQRSLDNARQDVVKHVCLRYAMKRQAHLDWLASRQEVAA